MSQVNKLKTWLVLDSTNGAYAGVIASVTAYTFAHHGTISITNGRWTNSKVVECLLSEAEFILLGISPGSGVMLCRFSYSILYNNKSGPATITATTYGDNRLTYGVYPKPVTAIPTDGVDRAVAWAKNTGSDTFIFVDEAGNGTGDGSSRINRKSIHSAGGPTDFESYSGIIWIGTLSRFINEGNGGGGVTIGASIPGKAGSSGTRTVWLSDVDSPAQFMGGAKIGNSVDGADANWTNDGGGRWHIHSTSTAGGGPFTINGFVMTNAGGTTRALTMVASAAACSALADSCYISAISGNNDLYVHLADGSDPENTTFFAPYTTPGIIYSPVNNYIDIYGLKFYQQGVYSFEGGASYNRFYNCYWGYYAAGPFFVDRMPEITEGTGAMSYSACSIGRLWHGCEAEYASAGFYDASTASNVVPEDTTLLDFYFHNIGVESADAFGIDITVPGDSHCVAFEGGHIGLTVQNLRCHNVAPETIVLYIRSANFADPAGGPLEGTDGFTVGYPVAKCFTKTDLTRQFFSPAKDILIEDFLITGILDGGSYGATEGMTCSLNGDGAPYGYADQIENIVIRRGRIEYAMTSTSGAGIRNKWCLNIDDGASNREIDISEIVTRGAPVGHYTFGGTEDEEGGTVESSWYVHDCDFHATLYLGSYVNHSNTTKRLREYRSNTYRIDDVNDFDFAAAEHGNFTYWQTHAYGNDILDPSPSATSTIPVSTGSATASISGVPYTSNVQTASLGTDPDGATSSLTYQWALDGDEISGATSSTYSPTIAGELSVAIVYFAGGNWKVATASATISSYVAPPPPPPPPPPATGGGIPLSREDHDKKQKKNRRLRETVELAEEPVRVAVVTGIVETKPPPVIRSSPELKQALDTASGLAELFEQERTRTERAKKIRRRQEDEWFLN